MPGGLESESTSRTMIVQPTRRNGKLSVPYPTDLIRNAEHSRAGMKDTDVSQVSPIHRGKIRMGAWVAVVPDRTTP